MSLIYLIFTPIIVFFLNKFLKKNKIFYNYSGDSHQKFVGEKFVPLTGGFYLIIFFSIIMMLNYLVLYFFLISIFFIGILSDIKFISSPIKRLILQTLLTIFFIYMLELYVTSTKVILIDEMLANFYFSIFFTSFCLIILMNGSNFIDGLNGLVLGYYLIILLTLYNLDMFSNFHLSNEFFSYLIYLIIILLIFNFFNIFYLGDSGTYLLSCFVGCVLIAIYNQNQIFSPFFVVLLLWYPCFENLFSIIRKFKIKKSPIDADSKHLHQLIFYFLKKKFKRNNLITNNCSSIIINLYNLIIFFTAKSYIHNTQFLIFLLLLNITVYTFFYVKLFNSKYKID